MPHTRRTRLRRWLYNRMPEWAKKRDFEVFAAILCVTAGVPLLFGKVEAGSLEAQLPPTLVNVWAATLTVGGSLILLGIVRSVGRPMSQALFWLRTEAYGLTMLAYAGYVYALLLFLTIGVMAFPALMIILIFALTCHSREVTIQLDLADWRAGVGLNERH